MWSMTKKAVLFAAGLVMVAGGTASAAPVDVKVPFPFIVQGKTMPAGDTAWRATRMIRRCG